MSSIQDRIRRLQSADAHPPSKPPLSTQTSLHTPSTPSKNPSQLSNRAAKFQPPPLTHSSSSSSPQINPLNRRVEALQAGLDAGRLQHRVNRIQQATHNTHVGGLVDGKMAFFENPPGQTGVVERTVGTLERVANDKAMTKAAWNDPAVVVAKMAVFEKDEGEKGKHVLSGRTAMFEAGKPDADNASLAKKTALFEAVQQEEAEVMPRVTRETPLLNRAAKFQGDQSENGKSNAGDEQETALLKRAAIFEHGTAEMERKETQAKDEVGQVEEDKGLLQRAAMFEGQPPRKQEEPLKRKDSGLLRRAALFEDGKQGGKISDEAGKNERIAVDAKRVEGKVGDRGKVGKEKNLVDELKEVKAVNEALVERLIELSGAFRRLEKSREEMQERLKKLESSQAA